MSNFKWRSVFIISFLIFFAFFCINKYFNPQTEINKKTISASLNKAENFLISLQKKDGSICDSVNPLFKVWETVIASQAIYNLKADTNNINLVKALNYLEGSQNNQMLLCHNLKCKEGYCIETSSIYLQLLVDINKQQTVKKAFDTIALLQQKTGDWMVGNPDVKEATNFPSVTAFALCALQKFGYPVLYENNAVAFLVNKQNELGSWGKTWEYYNIDAYAIWAVSQAMLYNSQLQKADTLQQKVIQFILNNQHKDGSWGNEKYEENVFPNAVSPQLETALTIVALQNFEKILKQKNNQIEHALKKGINYLMNKQQLNGVWDGGTFPIDSYSYVKKEYVFASSMAIIALNNYMLSLKN